MNLAVNFAPPRSRIIINEQHTTKHLNNLSLNHPFNYALSMLVDETLFKEQEPQIQQLLSQQQSHFYICQASPLYLISILDFLNANHQQDQCHLYVHSVGSRTESANQMAIFPKYVSLQGESHTQTSPETIHHQHTIYLQIDKDTYEELGLEGSVVETYSHHNHHDRLYKSQYKVIIHWPQKSQAVAERVTWALQRLGKANVLCSAYTKYQATTSTSDTTLTAPYKSIDLEPIFKQLNDNFASMKQDLCAFKKINGYGSDIRITKHSIPQFVRETDQSSELVRQVLHTLGAISTGVSLEVLSPIVEMEILTEKQRSVSHLTISGFIPPHIVCNLVQLLQKLQHEHWSCVLVRGFEDAVISWRENAHGYGMSGENDYAIIFSGEEDQKTISCQILGQLDQL